ncbi:hypothetical protein BJI67_16405 (plasmid) [Acidihalobacter aeolianus]|uniref:Phosphoadenosine phosphosulphate reductase domain-containing protein n=1 Tax=Acidihalobacter aeolianus TaxID=2792603 RepID=A0A1D8KCZ2_9GAMM|nr:phosphoadenosine phosphosulfate reductase family protein [Acidihalobacter aeolianus]AOV18820.1 hypothetical protein BJI67_16405 [Acidihalobacter aeolianus]
MSAWANPKDLLSASFESLPAADQAAGGADHLADVPVQFHAHVNGPGQLNQVAVTDEVEALLRAGAVCSIGTSGGKDSVACALAVSEYLDQIGHTGPRILIHADLGRVEWQDSLPGCERLAEYLGWELMVVRRKAGDMLARWQGRWANNVRRYQDLSCVKLILPWSTPALRFCTSEQKTDVICSALKKRFPGHDIINATGIRRQESARRRRMDVSGPMAKLSRKGRTGLAWNPIIEWPLEDVLYAIRQRGLQLHEAYRTYHTTRVSCVFCIMSSHADLIAASTCEDNAQVYRDMVALEARSSFAFQGNQWLGDIAPELLDDTLLAALARGKRVAVRRNELEARIPEHLLYTKGWPTCLPTRSEAVMLAGIRAEVSDLLEIEAVYLTATEILERYVGLIAVKEDTGIMPDACETTS